MISGMDKQEEGDFVSKKVSYMVQAIEGALPKETIKAIKQQKSDPERFSYVWGLKEVHDVLSLEKEYEEKSAELAKIHREKGNEYFQKKSYLTALGEYNMSVVKAPWSHLPSEGKTEVGKAEQIHGAADDGAADLQANGLEQSKNQGDDAPEQNSGVGGSTENEKAVVNESQNEVPKNELALALANRSAALLHLKKYRECLEDIRLALEADYPEESCYKLYERRGSCYLELGNGEVAASSFSLAQESLSVAKLDEKARNSWTKTLAKQVEKCKKIQAAPNSDDVKVESTAPLITGGPSSSHPDASAYVRINYNNVVGRHAVAGQDIKVGDVLMVDRPFASVLYPRFQKSHCYHCFAQVLVPIPCVQCSSVVYCGQQCRDASWTRFHKHECKFFALLDTSTCAKIGHLAVRLLMVVGLNDALDFIRAVQNRPSLETVGVNKDGVYVADYGSVYDMVAHGDARPSEQLFEFSIVSCLLMKILQLSEYVQLPESSSDFAEIGGLLLRHLQIIQCNGHRIMEIQQPDRFAETKPEELGIGIYPTAALVNHSCDPSADLSFYGNSVVVRAIRNINQDEEIAISYGPLFYETKELRRQAQLKGAYYFSCRCQACKEHWPILEEMFNESPGYCCGNCRANLSTEERFERKFYKCSKCQYKQDMEEVVGQLQTSYDLFAKAMNNAMSGRADEALPDFVQHLLLLQRYIRHPWQDLCACQSAVKQCYRLQANKKA